MACPNPAEPIVEHAPAKLNLDLLVTARRSDGYHELDSLVTFARFGDELTFRQSHGLSLEITGPFASELEAAEDNLVLRAARALAAAGDRPAHAHIRLDKRLPVAAGIGGGSADAAAALRGLQRLWGTTLSDIDLAELGLALGADVPVCLLGRPVRMRGIGERLQPLIGLAALDVVLINPRRPLATAAVFRSLRPETFGPRANAVPTAPTAAWLQGCRNDLEAAARRLVPAVAEILAALDAEPGCLFGRMSGSGPTCIGCFESPQAAATAAERISLVRPEWWVTACQTLGTGPD